MMVCDMFIRYLFLFIILFDNTLYASVRPKDILKNDADSAVVTNPYTKEEGGARKGAISAAINNIVELNTLLESHGDSKQNKAKILNSLQVIDELIPSVKIAGMFNLFPPEMWMSDQTQLGKIAVGILYFNYYPNDRSHKVAYVLKKLKRDSRFFIVFNFIQQKNE
ncbi:MAG: hypothetical protein ACI8ZF_000601 [Candidatus Midichloriaceae bacterium]|jgi:hypothetical protein